MRQNQNLPLPRPRIWTSGILSMICLASVAGCWGPQRISASPREQRGLEPKPYTRTVTTEEKYFPKERFGKPAVSPEGREPGELLFHRRPAEALVKIRSALAALPPVKDDRGDTAAAKLYLATMEAGALDALGRPEEAYRRLKDVVAEVEARAPSTQPMDLTLVYLANLAAEQGDTSLAQSLRDKAGRLASRGKGATEGWRLALNHAKHTARGLALYTAATRLYREAWEDESTRAANAEDHILFLRGEKQYDEAARIAREMGPKLDKMTADRLLYRADWDEKLAREGKVKMDPIVRRTLGLPMKNAVKP